MVLALSFLVGAQLSAAEDIRVSAEVSARQVPLNGRLQLMIRVEGTQKVIVPEVELDGFASHYVGPSTEISVINGQMSTAISHTFILSPTREGRLTIAPIPLTIQGNVYQTDPIEVEVLAAGSFSSRMPGLGGPTSAGSNNEEGLRLVIGVDRTSAYLNQAIPARVQLLIQDASVRDIDLPTLEGDGFLIKSFGEPEKSQVTLGGREATLLELDTVIIPIRAGTLMLGPAQMTAQVLVRSRSYPRTFGPFANEFFEEFFSALSLQPVTVTAEPISIEVLPLPQEGKPQDFNGAVGQFALAVEAKPQEVTAGEPLTLNLMVLGDGNFDSVQPPRLVGDLSHFKVYDPKQTSADEQVSGLQGRKTFEQVLIPLDAAVNEIPPVRFSYFDPLAKEYKTLSKGPIPLKVNPAAQAEPATVIQTPAPAATPSVPETLGRDIAYIKDEMGMVMPPSWRWYKAIPWIFGWFVFPILLLVVSEGLRRRKRLREKDPAAMRSSHALRVAQQRFRQLQHVSPEKLNVDFYGQVFRIFQSYIGDRLNVSSDGLTRQEIEHLLLPRGVPKELLRELSDLLHHCESARFARQESESNHMKQTLHRTETLLKQLERCRLS